MGQGAPTSGNEKALAQARQDGNRAHNTGEAAERAEAGNPKAGAASSTTIFRKDLSLAEQEAKLVRSLCKNLEARIACPHDLNMAGKAYKDLLEWSNRHGVEDLDWASRFPVNATAELQEVLDVLEFEPMYPAWRRQALDEAYMLLFEDIAKQGDRIALEQLPEPHIPESKGYRTLNDNLVTASTTRGGASVQGFHEQGTGPCYCHTTKCDYEIRIGPTVFYDNARQKSVSGREIVAAGMSQRQCCLDPLTQVMQAVMPGFPSCCGRGEVSWSSLLFGLPQKEQGRLPPPPAFPEPPDVNQPAKESARRRRAEGEAHPDDLLQPSAGTDWWK